MYYYIITFSARPHDSFISYINQETGCKYTNLFYTFKVIFVIFSLSFHYYSLITPIYKKSNFIPSLWER